MKTGCAEPDACRFDAPSCNRAETLNPAPLVAFAAVPTGRRVVCWRNE
jgi:hypothetical protein